MFNNSTSNNKSNSKHKSDRIEERGTPRFRSTWEDNPHEIEVKADCICDSETGEYLQHV